MKYFISQPMKGKTSEEILEQRERIIAGIKKKDKNAEILNSYFPEYNPESGTQPLTYLSKALAVMAEADIAVFGKGFDQSRGCKIEYVCASEYNKAIVTSEE